MSYKLLLADDSVTIQRVIELTFADEDVKVTAVGDGQAAIDRITADPPDIVLADVGMPSRDGYEVAAFVKESPELSGIPVLLLTGAFEPVDEARARLVRCDGVLAKPFEPQLLIGRVRELLAARPSPAPAPASRTPDQAPAEEADELTPAVPPVRTQAGFTPEDFALDVGTMAEASLEPPPADISLDDYFDRLDAAFTSLSGAPAGQLKEAATGADTSWAPSGAGAWQADPAGLASTPPPAAPLSPLAAVVSRSLAPDAAEPAAVRMPAPVSVADAFTALLEAEQQGSEAPAFSPSSALPADADAILEKVAARLADRLDAQGLRETVVRLVSETAERLVREEIERLKAAARG